MQTEELFRYVVGKRLNKQAAVIHTPASESERYADVVTYKAHCLANTLGETAENKLSKEFCLYHLRKKSCFKYHNRVVICNLL